jgi:hypothetical protein
MNALLKGNYESSLQWFIMSLKIESLSVSEYIESNTNIAAAYHYKGDYKNAVRHYNAALMKCSTIEHLPAIYNGLALHINIWETQKKHLSFTNLL